MAISASQQKAVNMPRSGWMSILPRQEFFASEKIEDDFDPQDVDAVERRKGKGSGAWSCTMPITEGLSEHKVFGAPKSSGPSKAKIREMTEARIASEKNVISRITKFDVHGRNITGKTSPDVSVGESRWMNEKSLDAALEARRAEKAVRILEKTMPQAKHSTRSEGVQGARQIRRAGTVRKVITLAPAALRDMGKAVAQVEDANGTGIDETPEIANWDEAGQLHGDRFPNMLRGLGRDLTVSQCRDKGVMGAQRRVWTDVRGTVLHAR